MHLLLQWGETPVSIAIRRHHHKVADVLFKSGVHINVDYKVSNHL